MSLASNGRDVRLGSELSGVWRGFAFDVRVWSVVTGWMRVWDCPVGFFFVFFLEKEKIILNSFFG